MKGIQVRIRHVDDASGAELCEARYDELDDLIQQVKEWGVRYSEHGTNATEFTGEMVVEGGKAFFEIIVETGGEE